MQAISKQEFLDARHEPVLQKLSSDLDLQRAQKEYERIESMGAWMMIWSEPDYPKHLGQISNPPLVLYGMGRKDFQQGVELGFVGPRKPSHYGQRVAQWLAKELVAHEMTLVSGMALGIDAVAHNIALESRGYTVAVVAHGLAQCYPAEHRRLYNWIAKEGTVLTEYTPDTKPLREFFPARNRIISGLSQGLLVVEAGRKSGVRITANHAIEQFREIYAVPGPIDQELSMYPNMLIAEGAKMVRSARDILEDFPQLLEKAESGKKEPSKTQKLNSNQQKVLQHFYQDGSKSIEQLRSESQLPTSKLLQTLTELELEGWVSRRADARYTLLRK